MTLDKKPDTLDRRLIFEFFVRFSVFEYALKRAGFICRGEGAKANWGRFADTIQGQFKGVARPRFQKAIAFLLAHPPRRQIVRESRLCWGPARPRKQNFDEAYILDLVRIVRNNVFHGGKYPQEQVAEVARNQALLQSALTVLKSCSALNEDVSAYTREALRHMIGRHEDSSI